MKEFNLKPGNNQKSFYGKAIVIETETGYKLLKSYETFVCMLDPENKFIRLWGGYSATTSKHVNSFLNLYGLCGLNKKEWNTLPVPRDYSYGQEIASKVLFNESVQHLIMQVDIPGLQNSIKEYRTEVI